MRKNTKPARWMDYATSGVWVYVTGKAAGSMKDVF